LFSKIDFLDFYKHLNVFVLTLVLMPILHAIYLYAINVILGPEILGLINVTSLQPFNVLFVLVLSIFLTINFYGHFFDDLITSKTIYKSIFVVSFSILLIYLKLGDYLLIFISTLILCYIYFLSKSLIIIITAVSFRDFLMNFVDYEIYFMNYSKFNNLIILGVLLSILGLCLFLIKRNFSKNQVFLN